MSEFNVRAQLTSQLVYHTKSYPTATINAKNVQSQTGRKGENNNIQIRLLLLANAFQLYLSKPKHECKKCFKKLLNNVTATRKHNLYRQQRMSEKFCQVNVIHCVEKNQVIKIIFKE